MSTKASIELRDLKLQTQIGTYKTDDIIPHSHLLDLTLWIDSNLVFISEDKMSNVFDYDPLVLEITRLASNCHYETQERLMSRITEACASYPQIQSLEIGLRKSPVHNNSGSLGVRLSLDEEALLQLRS
ncbi:dihydroneopterin aldolase [Polynucleobacter sp. AP-Kaivos-20-H2]|uniref:dihydroneopterin aldolase n=1 Tax=Polynucleobacter sp. AP-Kaivos-20-H2 TaxID=2689104 RepID=UPI001C20D681|nr:dihydroneopterin aldolase [Polynucleobacter sp. AP-Kaivos-20-H2]MBU3605045.1 dihydroneopterin aldolase [Polynucleobacter sp. AP-Kaivos-20-H2]